MMLRAMLKTYRYVEWKTKLLLLRAEDSILEVGE